MLFRSDAVDCGLPPAAVAAGGTNTSAALAALALDYVNVYSLGGAARRVATRTCDAVGGFPLDYLSGMPGLPVRTPYARGGNDYVKSDGRGDGRSDHVPAVLSPGEFVMDAETVALAGNGDNEAGARRLEGMRQNLRKQKGRALAQGKFSPDTKPLESYMPKPGAKLPRGRA